MSDWNREKTLQTKEAWEATHRWGDPILGLRSKGAYPGFEQLWETSRDMRKTGSPEAVFSFCAWMLYHEPAMRLREVFSTWADLCAAADDEKEKAQRILFPDYSGE